MDRAMLRVDIADCNRTKDTKTTRIRQHESRGKIMAISNLNLRVLVASGVIVAGLGTVDLARAQDASVMSCEELWHERNQIYADNGYCFKTERAQSEFGRGCFPPYGRLGSDESRRVRQLQSWERRQGCPM